MFFIFFISQATPSAQTTAPPRQIAAVPYLPGQIADTPEMHVNLDVIAGNFMQGSSGRVALEPDRRIVGGLAKALAPLFIRFNPVDRLKEEIPRPNLQRPLILYEGGNFLADFRDVQVTESPAQQV